VPIYFEAVSWTTHSGLTYIPAGMLGACIYFMAVGWTAHSRCIYMLAGTLVAGHIYVS